mgnify:CR=1 FL=1
MMGSDKLNSSVTKHESWLELRRGWLWSFWKVYSIPTLAVIPNRDGHDKREQFIEYSLCLRHSPRYHGVRPPNSRRWQWENDRSKSFVFPQIELISLTTHRRDLRATTFLPELTTQISIQGQKTFNLMMTAIEKHHSGVINCWIWRATVFSCLAPVEWDFVGHLIRAGACGGLRRGWCCVSWWQILTGSRCGHSAGERDQWLSWRWLECCVVRVLMTIHYAIPGRH